MDRILWPFLFRAMWLECYREVSAQASPVRMTSTSVLVSNYGRCVTQAVDFVRHHSKSSEVLVVGATTEAAAEVIRIACQQATIGAHAISLRNLARVLAESRLCASGLTEITSLGREALIASFAPNAKLHYLAPISKTRGFVRALSRTIRELRMNAVKPAGDLATLLSSYERALRDGGYGDVATVFSEATRVTREGSHAFCGLPLVLLDVPARHTLERGLVDSLVAASRAPLVFTLEEGFHAPNAEIFSASSESLECTEIARRMLAMAESGVGFDRIAVLSRDITRLQPLLDEAFTRAGIPAYFSGGCVRPSPAGRALLALLECALEGLSATRFLEYLSLGQAPAVQPGGWERMIVNAAVVGGHERWVSRLQAIRRLDPERSKQVEDLENFALPLLERLSQLPKYADWGEWLERLAELSQAYVRGYQPVLDLLDRLEPLASVGPVNLRDVLTLLDPHLRTLREPVEGARYGRVFAGAIEDARGMSFDVVFLPGLCEGSFPRPLREDPLLLNDQRIRYGMAIIDEADERALLNQAAACAKERLVASYSRIDLATGRARVPSLYAYETLRASRGAAFDPAELQRHAESNVETTLAWPAPHRYQNALDDTEYDLAVLREPFEAVTPRPGAGAYLSAVNPLAVDVLRNRWRRWHSAWHGTDGVFEEIDAQLALKSRRLTERAYSPTALQQFAMCPYRFLLDSIVVLKPLAEATAAQRMHPATRGIIFHRVQARIMEELSPPIGDLASAYESLALALRTIAAEEALLSPPAIPHVWNQEIQRLHADLRGWLAEYARSSQDWIPVGIEEEFETTVFDRYRIAGQIDVIEEHLSGALRVVDHKTGTPPRDKPMFTGSGEVLQPVLYALAAESRFAKPVGTGRLYYATLRGNYQSIDVAVNGQAREQVASLLATIDEAIDNGEFHTSPRQDACEFCDYTPVCGPYEEERARRKPKLTRLETIRRTK